MRSKSLIAALSIGAALVPAATAHAATPSTSSRSDVASITTALERADQQATALRRAVRLGATARIRITLRATQAAAARAEQEVRRLSVARDGADAPAAADLAVGALLVVEQHTDDAVLFTDLLDDVRGRLSASFADAVATAIARREALLALVAELQRSAPQDVRPQIAEAVVGLTVRVKDLAAALARVMPRTDLPTRVSAKIQAIITGLPARVDREAQVWGKVMVDVRADLKTRVWTVMDDLARAMERLGDRMDRMVRTGAKATATLLTGLTASLAKVSALLTTPPAPAVTPAPATEGAPVSDATLELLASLLVRVG
ncbi:hypothetical protein GKE82_20595 [Conexibacter sp. W3-3-2]|uniref:hypothetical protein n=1 Tax=Conexibacter sp. W3-3-2 TaxID=2675227 RepID=UPI0012B864D6|nr:hypothetical protein [Conexibacter sp. W3-3-2]MTD46622.1 hypothetical protein [Conexibacter sp. W3-3-2]